MFYEVSTWHPFFLSSNFNLGLIELGCCRCLTRQTNLIERDCLCCCLLLLSHIFANALGLNFEP